MKPSFLGPPPSAEAFGHNSSVSERGQVAAGRRGDGSPAQSRLRGYWIGMKKQVQPVALAQAPPAAVLQVPCPAQHGCVVEQF
jgi:hypothetical protein